MLLTGDNGLFSLPHFAWVAWLYMIEFGKYCRGTPHFSLSESDKVFCPLCVTGQDVLRICGNT